jgi:ribonuclease HI
VLACSSSHPSGNMYATYCTSIFWRQTNVAEYEASVNGLRIAVELGVRRLDARGDSQLVIDQVMKNSHCRDRKMEAYCDEFGAWKTSSVGWSSTMLLDGTTRPRMS